MPKIIVSPSFRSKISLVLLIGIYFLAVIPGLLGLNFGDHWDESRIIDSVIATFQTGRPVPGWYNYPSVSYDIVLGVGIPQKIQAIAENSPEIFLSKELNSKVFLLRVRAVFMLITLLSIVWTFLLVKIWQKNSLAALLVAGLVASSWELAYHARWIAPDGLLVQFGMLTIALVFMSLESSNKRALSWLILSAICAGLTAGTKYYGGMYLLPVMIGLVHHIRVNKLSIKTAILYGTMLFLAFATIFLLTTPGAVLELHKFIQDIQFEVYHYGQGHFAHDVSPGIDHAGRLFAYLGVVVLSPYWQIALIFSSLALIGLYEMRRDGIRAVVFLCVPILYIPYISLQRVMIVRNDLLLIPFLAVLSTRGVAYLVSVIPRTSWKWGLVCGVMISLAINQLFLFRAAESIRDRKSVAYRSVLVNYIVAHPDTKYYFSPGVRDKFGAGKLSALSNLTNESNQADMYVDTLANIDKVFDWGGSADNSIASNWPAQYIDVTGPFDVNINYYPDWTGNSRFVAIPASLAKSLGLIRP